MNMDNTFISIKEIKTPVKLSAKIYLYDFIFVCVYSVIMYQLHFLVSDYLDYLYLAFCIIWGIFLTMPSRYNKEKRNWQTLFLFIVRNQDTYTEINECRKKVQGESTIGDRKGNIL